MILDERQAWLLFVGLLAASMGLSLFCDADEYAGALKGWGSIGAESRAPALTRWYRGAAALFGAAGAALAAAALAAPHRIAGQFKLFPFNDQGRVAGGVLLVLAGTTLAALHVLRRPSPLPAGLDAEAGSGAPLRRRLAAGARWARVGLITLYGCFLLSRVGGYPQ